jgi:hypothetical protein
MTLDFLTSGASHYERRPDPERDNVREKIRRRWRSFYALFIR